MRQRRAAKDRRGGFLMPSLSEYERIDVQLLYRLRDDVGPRKSEQELLALALAGNPAALKFMSSMSSSPEPPSEEGSPPVSDERPEVVDLSLATSHEGGAPPSAWPDHLTVWRGSAARIVAPTLIVLPPAPPFGWGGVDVVTLEFHQPIQVRFGMYGSGTVIAALSGEKLERAASVMAAAGSPRPYRLGQRLEEGDVLVLDLDDER